MPSLPLEIRGLSANYGQVRALHDLSLSLAAAEVLAVVGPSGCGKTTLLRCLAGFLEPAGGTITLGDRILVDPAGCLPPERRGAGIVFQNYALWPHMTALENVSYPWRVRGLDGRERRDRAAALLSTVGLAGLEQRHPAELSGGQQQRVALARALACEPDLLLLDEPLSNVDATLRQSLQDLILDVIRDRGLTTLVATHDLDEAFALADRVAILRDGCLVQVGTPADVSRGPVDGFVARFFGGMNVVPVIMAGADGDGTLVQLPGGEVLHVVCERPSAPSVLLCARPEHVCIGAEGAGLPGVVTRVTLRGGRTEYHVRAGGVELRAWETGMLAPVAGDAVTVLFREALLLPPGD